MARYKNITSGAVVNVREDKALGSEWKRLDKGEGLAPTGYAAMKVADLKAAIDERNTDRDPEGDEYLSTEGNKADLVATLEADDASADDED